MTLFLHAGLPKTGSSSIQALMHAARDLLSEHGVHYWDHVESHNRPLRTLLRDPDLAPTTLERIYEERYGDAATITASLEALFAREGAVLLSGEGLSTFSATKLLALRRLSGREVKVVIYVREPRSWFASGVQQRIKTGATFAEAVTEHSGYRDRVENVIEAFGRDAVDLRLYRSSPDGRALIRDFLSAIDLPVDMLDAHGAPAANPSLGHDAIWFIEAVTRRAIETGGGERVGTRERKHMAVNATPALGRLRKAAEALGGHPFRLPREAIATMLAERAEDIAWMSRTMGVDLLSIAPDLPTAEPARFDARLVDLTIALARDVHGATLNAQRATARSAAAVGDDAAAKRALLRARALGDGDAALGGGGTIDARKTARKAARKARRAET